MEKILEFTVKEQTIRKKDFLTQLCKGTVGYLKCHFDFQEPWDDLTKIAVFYFNGKEDAVYLDKNNICNVPDEAAACNKFSVAVCGVKEGFKILTGKAEGEYISIDDAADWRLSNLEIAGKSEQLQTTGKNLFDMNAVTSGMYINNSNGEPTNNSVCSASDYIDVTNLENIYISAETTGARWGAFYNASKTFISGISAYGIVKIPTGAAYLRITVTTAAIGTAQIEVGTAATAYEPYTGGKPAPSPDYPQEIKSVENPAITVCGKNLCPSTGKSLTMYGVTYKRNEDGSITFNGTNTTSNAFRFNTEKIFLPAGDYTLSGITGGLATTYALRIGVGRADTWKLEIYDGQRTFTLSEPTLITATLVVKPGTYSNVTVYPQIEKGTTSTSYEPYAGHTVTLTDITLRSLPDGTTDQLKKRNGVWGIERKIGENTYIGAVDETWIIYSGAVHTGYMIRCVNMKINGRQNGYSNKFVGTYTVAGRDANGITFGGSTDQNVYLTFDSERFPTVADWMTWLSSNPLTVQYALANPTWEPLQDTIQTELNKLESHTGQTNIFTDSPLQPHIMTEYIKDPNKVLSDITIELTKIKEQLAAIQA